MRLALVHPTYWPEVRRGSERFVHDLSAYLARRGHDVTILTSHRGHPSREVEDGVTVIRGLRPPARLAPRGAEPHALHASFAALAAQRRRFDLVHALHIPDAWGVSWSSRPLVVSLMGYPDDRSLDAYRYRRSMLERAARRARAVHTLSAAAADALRAATGIDSTAIHPGTDTAAFAAIAPREERPTVFCAASPADPRKRVPLLVEAFARVRRARPEARLVIDAGGREPDPSLRADGVELVDARADGLAAHYARSWLTVLPSEREAFGLVLVESLAAGTPAVGMRDGGVPEILDRPDVGVLCERPEPEALAAAIERGLELSRGDGVRRTCAEHARRWDWDAVGARFEALYRDAIAGAGGRRR